MPSFLTVFTLASVGTQTGISLLISWLTLQCKLQPEIPELQETTVVKLLYLYDPQACGRIYLYNYTLMLRPKLPKITIQWPEKNDIAAGFRQMVKLWMTIHIFWSIFCIGYMTQGHRPCGFYAALLPFSLIGVMILVMDIIYTAFFIADLRYTNTEEAIFNYINLKNDSLHIIPVKTRIISNLVQKVQMTAIQDTSWVSLLFAYVSCRGVVLWVFNFWMIKDNYFEGLAAFRRYQIVKERSYKLKEKSLFSFASVPSRV